MSDQHSLRDPLQHAPGDSTQNPTQDTAPVSQPGASADSDSAVQLPAFTDNKTTAETYALQMRDLGKVFGNTIAVANLSIAMPQGSFYGFVGPNGAGKTTTLMMATGLLRPDRGTAFVDGVDIWKNPVEAKAKLGVLPDGMRLFDRMNGTGLVAYTGMLRGLDKKTATERAEQLIEALGLQDAGKKMVSDYSQGMTKKAALACALVHGPRVLVLDEPFEAVDPVSAANIQDILHSFIEGGGTVVLSSHVMETVEKLCSHVAIIDHGRLLANGTVKEVASGSSLDERFRSLVGGQKHAEGLEWLKH